MKSPRDRRILVAIVGVAFLLRLVQALLRWDEIALAYAAYQEPFVALAGQGDILGLTGSYFGLHPPLYSLFFWGMGVVWGAPAAWLLFPRLSRPERCGGSVSWEEPRPRRCWPWTRCKWPTRGGQQLPLAGVLGRDDVLGNGAGGTRSRSSMAGSLGHPRSVDASARRSRARTVHRKAFSPRSSRSSSGRRDLRNRSAACGMECLGPRWQREHLRPGGVGLVDGRLGYSRQSGCLVAPSCAGNSRGLEEASSAWCTDSGVVFGHPGLDCSGGGRSPSAALLACFGTSVSPSCGIAAGARSLVDCRSGVVRGRARAFGENGWRS